MKDSQEDEEIADMGTMDTGLEKGEGDGDIDGRSMLSCSCE